jgi:hypothetical protein
MAILFFNVKLLEYKTKNDAQSIVTAIDCLYYRKTYDRGYIPNLRRGNSFLLNPEGIIQCKLDPIYRAQYIRLAGRRNFLDYQLYNATWINLTMWPDIKTNVIQRNPLFIVEDNKLQFIYEKELN